MVNAKETAEERLEKKLDLLIDGFGELIKVLKPAVPEQKSSESKHLTKAGTPDHRFLENRAPSVRPPSSERPASESHEVRRGTYIELNDASYRDLRRIPMMGEGRAYSIIEYRDRKKKKGFDNWDDVEHIPGISKGMYEKLQEYCTVNGETIEDYLSKHHGGAAIQSGDLVNITGQFLENIKNSGMASPEEQKAIETVLKRASSRPPAP